MTTLTTRPLPLLPLAIARSMTCNERSPSTGSPTPPSSLHIMHPDNILLQSHGITSPRLSSASSVGSALCGQVYNKNCDSPPSSAFTVASENCDRGIRDIRNSPENHLDASETSDIYHQNTEDDNVTDRMSCCSEDSELSVGQEGCDNNDSEQNSNAAGKQVMDDSESVDNVSSLSDDNRLGSVGDQQCDDMSNDSSPNRDVDPIVMATAMRIPVPIVRPSPTRLQEEFLRKSHLYAEELMKQQMQFMAAARASAFSLRHPAISPEAGKVGFRPHIKQPEINDGLTNFSGIHSHLNAISKISSQLTSGESALSKLAAFGVREQSQSPPSSNSLHPNVPLHPHHFMNNNLNESSLKFSIDNILKADFGRRITDPLLKRSGGAGGFSGKGLGNRKASSRAADRTTDKHVTPIDLTSVVQQPALSASSNGSIDGIDKLQRHPAVKSPAAAAPSSTPSSSTTSQSSTTSPASSTPATATSSESSSSGGSGGPMVWPAWVYCTRYSDRPSSGPRTRKPKKPPSEKGGSSSDEKRPRTAFSGPQLARLKHEFSENRYLTERRRQQLSAELGLNEAQIKIWFQNKRAKIKKASGTKNPLALQLMAQGLYNHSTVPLTREEEELQELQAKGAA